ncbi:glycosyltransferase family 2 protein [Paenibacillus hemerocallicola]|uniref:Glycosyltransferase family 2 protein n=1 Tax=Paenibacillus hemerocallicola TaxID=1172614 RepID=A0A5C4T2U9_9BACL|nr:glycosyltransferase family 2 protein [Paenibacillus hemerocallicola]TNJ62479.1 glycosyltransferase family 2 protein [Paenibacillus hemerocallicola]
MTFVLIPSYEPDARLPEFVGRLKSMCDLPIVIVDDGSGEACKPIFKAVADAGCRVLTHERNRGKGTALKTGFQYIKDTGEAGGVVCADSDGQHLPEDIMKIAEALDGRERHVVMGSRRFTGKVPLRSRLGNGLTRIVFAMTTGTRVQDTQTGLRGYPAPMLEVVIELRSASSL